MFNEAMSTLYPQEWEHGLYFTVQLAGFNQGFFEIIPTDTKLINVK